MKSLSQRTRPASAGNKRWTAGERMVDKRWTEGERNGFFLDSETVLSRRLRDGVFAFFTSGSNGYFGCPMRLHNHQCPLWGFSR